MIFWLSDQNNVRDSQLGSCAIIFGRFYSVWERIREESHFCGPLTLDGGFTISSFALKQSSMLGCLDEMLELYTILDAGSFL